MPADSAKVANVEALVKKVLESTDHVDILFANAGATWGEKFDTHPDGAFAKVMDLNVKSVFNTIRLYVLFSILVAGHSTRVLPLTQRETGLHRYFRRMQRLKTHPVSSSLPL